MSDLVGNPEDQYSHNEAHLCHPSVMIAEEKEPSPPKQQVRITFNEESRPPVRQRIRLKRDTEQNENTVPSVNTMKGFKRERQIYLPPGRKIPGEYIRE